MRLLLLLMFAALPDPPGNLTAFALNDVECPAPRPGTLTLNTLPWTQVAVDGVVVGSTPLFRHQLSAGPHTLTLVNAGRGVDIDEPVLIEEGHAHKLKLLLATSDTEELLSDSRDGAQVNCVADEDAAWVTVDTHPWSKVWIDGRLVGATPVFRLKVSSGMHALRVLSATGILRATRFLAAPGEVVKVVLTLDPPQSEDGGDDAVP